MTPTITFEEYMTHVWQLIDVVTTISGYILDTLMVITVILYERRIKRLRNCVIGCGATFKGSTEFEIKAKMDKKYDFVVIGTNIELYSFFRKVWSLDISCLKSIETSEKYGITSLRLNYDDKYTCLEIKFDSKAQEDEIIGYLRHSGYMAESAVSKNEDEGYIAQ